MIKIIGADWNEDYWLCWLALEEGEEKYSLPATAPGQLNEFDLLAFFEAKKDDLWRIAKSKNYPLEIGQAKADFEALADKAAAEIEWLEATIPQVDAMTAAQVRDTVKRLAQENLETIKAWRYVIRRLS